MKPNVITRLRKFFVNYFSLTGQLVSQAEAEANIRDGVSFRGTNILILILAIFIASLGLNTNSTAVIIGAMLISPLMGPIIGVGLGVGIQDFDLIKRCVRNLLMAAVFSVMTATLYFLISPVNDQHSELLARTSPSIYDVLIGFFGGGAGIIALGSTNKGNVIPGVAIATALMPPLCTAGYGLATWQMQYFFGATYLFIINSIYIAFATFIGVKLMKYRPKETAATARVIRVRRVVYTLAILTMLPSVYITYRMLQQSKYNMRADEFVATECAFSGTQVLRHTVSKNDGQRTLTLTLIGRPLPADSLHLALAARLRYYGLDDTRLVIYQGGDDTAVKELAPTLTDVYELAQASIAARQHAVDSLSELLAAGRANANAAVDVAPEVRVLFPDVSSIGITTTMVSHPGDTLAVDTVNIVLVRASDSFGADGRTRLAEYIQARLHLKNVQIVELPDL